MNQRIIHMMHFPWDREQKLKENPDDFDKSHFDAMVRYAPDFEVRLWTYPLASAFCREHYPSAWEVLQKVIRPVMMVDVLRWMVVHHFGGIYWQMNTTPLLEMSAYFPSPGKSVRLFTEFDLSPDQCRIAASEPIRQGQPEEPKRVLIQVFAAVAGAAFVKNVISLLMDRVTHHKPQRDYDILFISGNAAISTAYDRFGKNDDSVELIDRDKARSMIKWHYRGTWRTDNNSKSGEIPDQSSKAKSTYSPGAGRDRVGSLLNFIYRYGRKHAHESMFQAWQVRSSALPLVQTYMNERNVRSVFEVPCGEVKPGTIPSGLAYAGGDLDRRILHRNRRQKGYRRSMFRFINLIYSAAPRSDLCLSVDFLERVPWREVNRILHNLMAGGGRFLALSHHPLLMDNWDTSLGDIRPVNFQKAPFNFPAPLKMIPCPRPDGRPDRCIAIWDLPAVARVVKSPEFNS